LVDFTDSFMITQIEISVILYPICEISIFNWDCKDIIRFFAVQIIF